LAHPQHLIDDQDGDTQNKDSRCCSGGERAGCEPTAKSVVSNVQDDENQRQHRHSDGGESDSPASEHI